MNNITILSEHLTGIKEVETIVFSYLDHDSLTTIFFDNRAAFHEILFRIYSEDEPIRCFQHWNPVLKPNQTPALKLYQLAAVLKTWQMRKLNVEGIYSPVQFSSIYVGSFRTGRLRDIARNIIGHVIEKHSKHVWEDWGFQKAEYGTKQIVQAESREENEKALRETLEVGRLCFRALCEYSPTDKKAIFNDACRETLTAVYDARMTARFERRVWKRSMLQSPISIPNPSALPKGDPNPANDEPPSPPPFQQARQPDCVIS